LLRKRQKTLGDYLFLPHPVVCLPVAKSKNYELQNVGHVFSINHVKFLLFLATVWNFNLKFYSFFTKNFPRLTAK